jgi:hypothetical protein
MSGKPMNGRVVRRPHSGPRVKFKQGPRSWKRRFLNEMRRTNNVLAGLTFARITWACYIDWLATGFLSQEELSEAEKIFHQRHPTIDIIIKQSDEELEDSGLGVVVEQAIEAVGYDESMILRSEGWISTDDWEDDI